MDADIDDDSCNIDIGRQKPDPYRSLHAQWMIPHHHQMKDHHSSQTIKQATIIAERDSAMRERDLAFAERKTAMAERDMAIFQRDAAISERNKVIVERDNAIAALNYYRANNNSNNNNNYNSRSMLSLESYRAETYTSDPKKEIKSQKSHSMRKSKKGDHVVDDNGNATTKKHRKEWKAEDIGSEVVFDESRMSVPVCSCTGKQQPCYKWGNGGWQSACCTTTLSMYPLPVMPNKRHARINGRKMSGSVFSKLLSRLAAEGHDLRMPIDLKDHWSKHGTNRYITIK